MRTHSSRSFGSGPLAVVAAAAACFLSAQPASADVLFVSSQGGTQVFRYEVGATGTPTVLSTITNANFTPANWVSVRLNGGVVVGSAAKISSMLPAGCGAVAGLAGATAAGALVRPFDLVLLGDTVYSLDASYPGSGAARIVRFDFNAAGEPVQAAATTAGGNSGRGITIHPGLRELFYTLCCGSNTVLRFRINDDLTLTANGSITGNGLNNPHGMAVSASGELFVVNAFGNSVSRFVFDAAGSATANGVITGNGMSTPIGAAFSPWGELFVASQGAGTVSRFTFNAQGVASANGGISPPAGVDDVAFATVPPPFLLAPRTKLTCPRGAASFSVLAPGLAASGFSYQWQRETAPGSGSFVSMADGSSSAWGGGGTISGSSTPVLSIVAATGLTQTDAGRYRCLITALCGSTTTDIGTLV